ncbi:MAG: ferritin-like domain-containing protein [Bdellovibrionia bacterium]
MTAKDKDAIVKKLNELLEMEISGLVRYLHYSLMITGPNRIPIVKWFKEQALEGFEHAATIGEKITALGGHPTLKVRPVPESNKHAVMDILAESLEFEKENEDLVRNLLPLTESNVSLNEMVRKLLATEQEHIEEVEKMLKK